MPPSHRARCQPVGGAEFRSSTSSVGGYLNFLQGVVRNGLYVGAPDQPNAGSNASNGYDITAAYAARAVLVTDAVALVKRLALLLCADQLSASTQTLVWGAQCDAGDGSQHRCRQTQPDRRRRADGDGLGPNTWCRNEGAPCT